MAPPRRSNWGKWIFGLVVIGGIAAGVVWYQKRDKEPPIEYKTVALARGDIIQVVTANGQLNPVKNIQVGSQISGIIKELKVDFNTKVQEGDVIAQIDPSIYQQSVEQAEAELASVQASVELAELTNRRATQLAKDNLIAQSETEKALADLHQAQAALKMREALLRKAKVDLERTTIYAPISGVVISRNIEVGQTVAASFNTPTLFLIANDLSKMQIEAMVSEADVGGVEENQKVQFNVDAFPGRPFTGTVKQVRYAPTTNQNVVTYTTVVEVNNADLKLRPGMTANASIVLAEKSNVLKLPNSALRFRPPEKAVVRGLTNAPGSTNRATGGPAVASAPGAGGGADFANMTPEERRRRFESMSPEEREAMRSRRGGGPGGGGEGRRRRPESSSRTVYLLKKETQAGKTIEVAEAISIKIGISDGTSTEVIEGLNEGDVVITSQSMPANAAAANMTGRSPFGGSPFGGGGSRGPR